MRTPAIASPLATVRKRAPFEALRKGAGGVKEVGGAFYRAAPSDGCCQRSSRRRRSKVRLAGATCAGCTRALSARLSRRGKPR